MRGDDRQQGSMFSDVDLEARVPADHPLRPMQVMVDRALASMSNGFESMYASTGRPSIPPERLLRALLIQILFSIRSERQLAAAVYNLVRMRNLCPG
jgi:transposase